MDGEHINAIVTQFERYARKWRQKPLAEQKLFTEADIWQSAANELQAHVEGRGASGKFTLVAGEEVALTCQFCNTGMEVPV